MIKDFPRDFWEETQSALEFIPTNDVPADILFTAVKMFLFDENKILLTKVPRGWDTPAGHIEKGEDIFDAVKRETQEEAGVVAGQIRFIGYLKIVQLKRNEKNEKYPQVSGIGIFLCRDFELLDFSNPLHEATERRFQNIDKVVEIHHRWSPLNESIMRYAYRLREI